MAKTNRKRRSQNQESGLYELWLHYKQGDDFAAHCEAVKKETGKEDVAAALRSWAKAFDENAATCRLIADALEGKAVGVDADVHSVLFTAQDDAAERALQDLASKKILDKSVIEDDES